MLTSKGRTGDFSQSGTDEKQSGLDKLQFGNKHIDKVLYTYGNFSIGHVAIWNEALDAARVRSVYKSNIILTRHKMCCFLKQHSKCSKYCVYFIVQILD